MSQGSDSFNATGPTVVAFETTSADVPVLQEFGVSVVGTTCGVYGQATTGAQKNRRAAPVGTGVFGSGDAVGVRGDGPTGVTGVGGSVVNPGIGVVGLCPGAGGSGEGVKGQGGNYAVHGANDFHPSVGELRGNRGSDPAGVFGESSSSDPLRNPSMGIGVMARSDAGTAVFGMIGSPQPPVFPTGVSGVAVYGFSDKGPVAVFDSSAKTTTPGTLAVFRVEVSPGLFQNVARIDLKGTGIFDGGTQTGGADIAEFITSQDLLHPGDLVEIDTDRPGQFRLATRPNSTAIAGVVSTNPGVIMNATNSASRPEDRPRLALAGCAPVKVTAENGPVKPGDLLVASRKPGHAMRAPSNPAPGTIVGKALGALGDATGVIDMLVMLR